MAAMRTFVAAATQEPIDEGLLLLFPAPHSVTGENVVEFHTHGSKAVVAAMIDAMTSVSGIRQAEPGEFTRRAVANGKMDLTSAEGLADLLDAESQQQRKAAFELLRGGLKREWEELREKVLDLSARAEAAIDYVGDEDETGGREEALVRDCEALRDEIEGWLRLPDRRPIRDGIRVVLAGPVNAGKSSLLNAIAGSDRAIVSDVEGTTRDIIEVPLRIDGTAYVFVDTAGLRESEDVIEQIGVGRTKRNIGEADILLWLGEPGESPEHERLIVIASKADQRSAPVKGAFNLSAHDPQSLIPLFSALKKLSETILPGDNGLSLTQWQRARMIEAREILGDPVPHDALLLAENLRSVRELIDHLLGRSGVEDLLDRIFGRFCLGK
ncbi:tRNA modification GTPase [Sphingomicrobium lutaoense]|uniref:tRNA modification GTPase MnmE n=1 Tax=Sphingomicrobium lutaoense TaxID=515949 RepID=A0A839Z599_9SPHN|nr:tRNA modification GTPase [Sphingomicrobium lutaoense]